MPGLLICNLEKIRPRINVNTCEVIHVGAIHESPLAFGELRSCISFC